jgi:hypothetical protein
MGSGRRMILTRPPFLANRSLLRWCLSLLAALSIICTSVSPATAADPPAPGRSAPDAAGALPPPDRDAGHAPTVVPGPASPQSASPATAAATPDSGNDVPDHILFVVGLFLLAPRLKPLLIQVTAFTVAHSITLGLCMADIVHLPSRLVETTIAASIAFVAIENICYKELKPWRWMVVFCFGLIHGLGFASALKELGLPPGHFFPALISFNVGVEAGQLTVIAVAAALTVWFWKKTWYRAAIVIPCSIVIAGIGLFWAGQRALGYGG